MKPLHIKQPMKTKPLFVNIVDRIIFGENYERLKRPKETEEPTEKEVVEELDCRTDICL